MAADRRLDQPRNPSIILQDVVQEFLNERNVQIGDATLFAEIVDVERLQLDETPRGVAE